MWEQLFGIANLVAMIAWAVLILAPRRDIVMHSLFFGPIFLLALGYATGLTLVLTGIVPTDGGGISRRSRACAASLPAMPG